MWAFPLTYCTVSPSVFILISLSSFLNNKYLWMSGFVLPFIRHLFKNLFVSVPRFKASKCLWFFLPSQCWIPSVLTNTVDPSCTASPESFFSFTYFFIRSRGIGGCIPCSVLGTGDAERLMLLLISGANSINLNPLIPLYLLFLSLQS